MAWRGLHLAQPARLSLADAQIIISRDDGVIRLPIEDLAWMVIDTPQVTLSSALLSACMEAGIVVVMTDSSHTPSGMILPFHRHHRQAEVAAMQVAISATLKKRLWQIVVRAKIANQAISLETIGQDATALRSMMRIVGSGDPDNVEARAARAYWPRLFIDFVRDDSNDKRNALLNYGYAVVRSAVARALVAAGLLPAFGVNHASVTNAFNLADDMIEPFRPFVDRAVWGLTDCGRISRGTTTVEERQTLASLLTEKTRLGTETLTLLVATERVAESLVRAMELASAPLLLLPELQR